MATANVKIIDAGGGGDYLSLAAWAAARKGDLVSEDRIEIAEVKGGGSVGAVSFTTADWTVDSTRHPIIRPNNGSRHSGVYDSSKAFLDGGAGDYCVNVEIAYCEIIGLVMTSTGTSQVKINYGSGAGKVVVDKCILKGGTHGVWVASGGNSFGDSVVKNTVSYSHAGAGILVVSGSGNAYLDVFNCTLIGTQYGLACSNGFSFANSQNNYLHGGTSSYGELTGGAITEGANDATSDALAITPSLRNIAHSTANFVNVTGGSENYHLAVGSALLGVGANLSGSGVVDDFEYVPRIVPYDIGADEDWFHRGGGMFVLGF